MPVSPPPEFILETCAPYARNDLASDLDAGWKAVAAAIVDDQVRAKNWDGWLAFCSNTRRGPYLINSDKPIQQQLLLSFAARVRRGHYGRGHTVQAQTPETALHHVAQTLVLAGYPDP
jgi:hypothetical protein